MGIFDCLLYNAISWFFRINFGSGAFRQAGQNSVYIGLWSYIRIVCLDLWRNKKMLQKLQRRHGLPPRAQRAVKNFEANRPEPENPALAGLDTREGAHSAAAQTRVSSSAIGSDT